MTSVEERIREAVRSYADEIVPQETWPAVEQRIHRQVGPWVVVLAVGVIAAVLGAVAVSRSDQDRRAVVADDGDPRPLAAIARGDVPDFGRGIEHGPVYLISEGTIDGRAWRFFATELRRSERDLASPTIWTAFTGTGDGRGIVYHAGSTQVRTNPSGQRVAPGFDLQPEESEADRPDLSAVARPEITHFRLTVSGRTALHPVRRIPGVNAGFFGVVLDRAGAPFLLEALNRDGAVVGSTERTEDGRLIYEGPLFTTPEATFD